MSLRYLHTMVRVRDLDASLDFYCNKLGLVEVNRYEVAQARFTLVFLAASADDSAQVELTYNWDPEDYGGGRNFGHLAYEVDDIYAVCQRLMDGDVTIQGSIVLSGAQLANLRDGDLYINVHTGLNASGEIRGQVTATN